MHALTIRQPWAWLIATGQKDIENRSWPTRVRGVVAIHAAVAAVPQEAALRDRLATQFGITVPSDLPHGALVGLMDIDACVDDSASPWFVGRYGFHIASACEVAPLPCRGRLGFWAIADYMLSTRHVQPSSVSRS